MAKDDDRSLCFFAGPSRPIDIASSRGDWYPPASTGDLRRALSRGYRQIVLADTLFLDAVPTHGEIRDVMRKGATVYGCSSAGALRAIELRSEGMLGRGWVYRLYRHKLLNDDGELACVLDDNYSAMCPSLLDIRYALGAFVAMGQCASRTASAFSEIKSVYFMRRTLEVVAAVLRKYLGENAQAVVERLEKKENLLKSLDLTRLAQALSSPARKESVPKAELSAIMHGLRLDWPQPRNLGAPWPP
jgi:hypothetical protein